MNKKYIVRKNTEFQQIIFSGRKLKNKYFVIYILSNQLNYNRFGISVGKKVANAVTRNKIKRQIKNILSEIKIKNSNDYVIIVRKEILTLSFLLIKENLIKLIEGEK